MTTLQRISGAVQEGAQAYLNRQPWERADLPMICRCLRSTRLPG